MRDCPACGKPVDGLQCGACGYSDTKPNAPGQFKQRRGGPCEHRGCSRWGTFKPEDQAGPWHCWAHYPAVPMPDWFRRKHPDFAKTFRPMSAAQIEADEERAALQA